MEPICDVCHQPATRALKERRLSPERAVLEVVNPKCEDPALRLCSEITCAQNLGIERLFGHKSEG
jgi:hypothetical protein